MIRMAFALVGLASVLCGAAGLAQGRQPDAPAFPLPPVTGRDSFDRYCATCHGSSGTGDGPVGASLVQRPADLTALAERNGGTFPRQQVLAYVEGTGRPIPAHGPTEMPLWGGVLRWFEGDAQARVRLNNLIAYVESLQRTGGQAVRAAPVGGADLFRAYCANCHGSAGHGDGSMAAHLRREPPDLTKYQARNRGAFPGDQLRRIIDGLEVAAHGNRTMPVWGDVFRRDLGGGRDESARRIDALVDFIRSIQERPAE